VWQREHVAPEVIAHRGSNREEPEHSLAAYLRALDEGADGVECDIRLTRDGAAVCVHDRTITRTSSGRGTVSEMNLADLMLFDFSAERTEFRDPAFLPNDPTRTAVLTLDRLLTSVNAKSPTAKFSIETKHPTRYGRYLELELLEALERHHLGPDRVRVMSFSRLAVEWMAKRHPFPTIYLRDRLPKRLMDGSLPAGVSGLGLSVGSLRTNRGIVEAMQARGHLVHIWVVNEPHDIEMCVHLGVDAIISDRPGFVREVLARG